MAHRTITDRLRQEWEVWNVVPGSVAGLAGPQSASGKADTPETNGPLKVGVSERLQHGWLAFQTHGERRRLSPAPDGWEHLDDAALVKLLSKAAVIPERQRLIE